MNSFIVEMDTFTEHIADYFFNIYNVSHDPDSCFTEYIKKQRI